MFYGVGYGSSSTLTPFDVNLEGTVFEIDYNKCEFKPFGWAAKGKIEIQTNQHVAGKGIGYQGGIGVCPGAPKFRNSLNSNGNAIDVAKQVNVRIPIKFQD